MAITRGLTVFVSIYFLLKGQPLSALSVVTSAYVAPCIPTKHTTTTNSHSPHQRSNLHGKKSEEEISTPSIEAIANEPALIRALEIASVVTSTVVMPVISSLIAKGLPDDDWEDFWSRSPVGGLSNAQRVTHALEQLGPTYVKFGQALASRPDVIPRSLADSLSMLQDNMQPFDSDTAKKIIMAELVPSNRTTSSDIAGLIASLSRDPIAAASVGQVYKGHLPGYGHVAVKVQRPGIRSLVERDASLLRTLATWIEAIPAFPPSRGKKSRLVATELVDAVDEFMSRIFEELDYRNEATNAATFASLYSYRNGVSQQVRVVVPEIFPDLCTDNVLVMEWLEGTKLTNVQETPSGVAENLALVQSGIECTLSQLLDTGVLHADPHGGNLLKIASPEGNQLGYLDFGLLSTVPAQVRDALVCAVAQLVFARDVDSVARLFGELQILPPHVLNDKEERMALTDALNQTMLEVLRYPDFENDRSHETKIPELRFDKLLDALARLVPRFRFQLPPYFINNARALSTLEGIARSLDPKFNVLQVLYPFALNRLLRNPTQSAVVDDTLQCLIRSPETGRVDRARISKLLSDSAVLTGYKKRKVLWDVMNSHGGQRLIWGVTVEEVRCRLPFGRPKRFRKSQVSRIPKKRLFRL